jgi:hypothetical protein
MCRPIKVVFSILLTSEPMGSKTTCHRCGWEWEYNGEKNRYCSCPNCKTSTPIGSETVSNNQSSSESSSSGQKQVITVENPVDEGEVELEEAFDEVVTVVYKEIDGVSENVRDVEDRLDAVETNLNKQTNELREAVSMVVDEVTEGEGGVEWDYATQ